MTKKQLLEAIAFNEEKLSLIDIWLHNSTAENPYRVKILADKRSVEIELRTKRFNLEQLNNGLPLYGEEIPGTPTTVANNHNTPKHKQ